MKPVNFEYARPLDVQSAARLLARESSAKVVAGCQSLGPMLNLRLVQPELLVDITGIEELRSFEEREDRIEIGACVTHSDVEDKRVADVTRGAMPGVAANIAYRAVRNRGTIGGSLSHADPSADWITILAALGATVTLRDGDGSRRLTVEDFVTGALETDLRPGELLVSISVPRLSGAARWGYYKACRKTGEFAHAIGAFLIDPEREVSRAVMGATESRPIVVRDATALISDGRDGRHVLDEAAADSLAATAGLLDPIDRRIHIVALRRAIERAEPQ